jgi:parvulin-like peptidyl-prolyl isomerase
MVKKVSKKKSTKSKSSKKKTVKKTEKKVDYEKYVISGLVILLIVLIGYAIVNVVVPKDTKTSNEGEVLVSVNNVPLYAHDVDKRFKYLQAQMGPQVTKEFVLNHSINQELLLQEAQKQGIIVDEEEIIQGVDKWLVDLKTQVSDEQLQAILSAQNITFEEFRNDTIKMYIEDYVVFTLLNQTIFTDIDLSQFANVSVTDEEIEQFYNENKENFNQVDASHILICYQGASRCEENRTKEEAKTEIEDIYNKLKENPNFENIAKEYSDCPSAEDGGNLGPFSKGQMAQEFEDAAFGLKYENQLSAIVETDFGYHIIKLNSKKSSFEDFKLEISMQLQYDNQQKAQAQIRVLQEKMISDYLDEIKKDSDIRYYTANPTIKNTVASPTGIQTFNVKSGEVCTENGKPIIRLFSTTSCPHCKWITDTYEETVMKYVKEGKIVAYHWKLDTDDDSLTSAKESFIPEEEKTIFSEFNPRHSIPTFVFGCKYYRIGNGYEQEKDLLLEKREFIAVIEKLLEETSNAE